MWCLLHEKEGGYRKLIICPEFSNWWLIFTQICLFYSPICSKRSKVCVKHTHAHTTHTYTHTHTHQLGGCSDDPGGRDNEISQRSHVTRLFTQSIIKAYHTVAISTPRAADPNELSSSQLFPTPEAFLALFASTNGFSSV